jgi:hypothetical protein
MSYIWKGARHAGEKTSKNESAEPKEQSVNKAANEKKPEKSKENDEKEAL